MRVPTNSPEQLHFDWGALCSFVCSDCGRSKCMIHTHMPFFCSCGHARMKHHANHPHICREEGCPCMEVHFLTPPEAVVEVCLLIVAIEAIDL